MARGKRIDVKTVLADPDLRRELMVGAIQATQACAGIETAEEQAERVYYIVSEGEKTAFFDLEKFRSGKDELDRRHEMFVQALRGDIDQVRFNVVRHNFDAIVGSPLTYRLVELIAHIFCKFPALEPSFGVSRQGLATTDDAQFIHYWWEVPRNTGWVPLAKGGPFSRFYADIDTVINWRENGKRLKQFIAFREGSITKRIYSQEHYFREGLTYLHRSMRGFCIRHMPDGCIFSTIGKAVVPHDSKWVFYLLGMLSSRMAEGLLQLFSSFSTFQAGMLANLPIPEPDKHVQAAQSVEKLARLIHGAKKYWDSAMRVAAASTSLGSSVRTLSIQCYLSLIGLIA